MRCAKTRVRAGSTVPYGPSWSVTVSVTATAPLTFVAGVSVTVQVVALPPNTAPASAGMALAPTLVVQLSALAMVKFTGAAMVSSSVVAPAMALIVGSVPKPRPVK